MYTALRATSMTLQAYLLAGFIADPDLRPLFDTLLGGSMVVSLNTPDEMEQNQQGEDEGEEEGDKQEVESRGDDDSSDSSSDEDREQERQERESRREERKKALSSS